MRMQFVQCRVYRRLECESAAFCKASFFIVDLGQLESEIMKFDKMVFSV